MKLQTYINKEIKIDSDEINEMIHELGVIADNQNEAVGLEFAKHMVSALIYTTEYMLDKGQQVVRFNELIKQLEEAKAKI